MPPRQSAINASESIGREPPASPSSRTRARPSTTATVLSILSAVDLTALILSVFDTVVSVGSVKYTRDQAKAAQDQRHMERTPQIDHAFIPRVGGHYYLQPRNDGQATWTA